MVKAIDFDSIITGSNPVPPARENIVEVIYEGIRKQIAETLSKDIT